MRARIPAALIGCLAASTAWAGQSLSPAEIDAAIRAGQSGKQNQLIARCEATIGFRDMFRIVRPGLNPDGSFEITLSLSTGRIAILSAAARRFYRPFTADQVPPELRVLIAVLQAEPREPTESFSTPGAFSVASRIEQIVIKSWPRGDRVIAPTELRTEPVEWSGLPGGTVTGRRAHARFSAGEIRELPPGEVEVVVVTEAGERKCVIGAGDRRRVFGR